MCAQIRWIDRSSWRELARMVQHLMPYSHVEQTHITLERASRGAVRGLLGRCLKGTLVLDDKGKMLGCMRLVHG